MDDITKIAINKAKQSKNRYKISAIGLNKKNEVICKKTNKKRFPKRGGGIHAEMDVMKSAGPSLYKIIICRINESGDLLPIDPCDNCQKKADELGIKIESIEPKEEVQS